MIEEQVWVRSVFGEGIEFAWPCMKLLQTWLVGCVDEIIFLILKFALVTYKMQESTSG